MPLKVTPRLEERINARWLFWHPWCLVLARKRLPFVDTQRTMDQCRTLHRERYLQAMHYKIREDQIRYHGLDDPRMDMVTFRGKMENLFRRRNATVAHWKIRKERKNANAV